LLAVIAILALLVGFGPAWTLRRDVRVGLLALYSVEALLAQSRLALVVGIAIALFPLLRVAQRSIIGTFVLLAGAAVAAGLLLAKSDALFGFFVRGQSIYELTTLTGRTVLWERALDLWATRPWTGLGYYSGHRFGIEFIPGPVEQSTLDNVWVETLLDVGISGTILLATFLALATVRMLRAARALPSSTALLMYGVAALAIFSTFFSPSIQGTNLASVVFILFFLAFQSSPTPGNKVTIPARKLRITARPFGAIQPPHHQTSTHHFSTPSPSPTRCSPSSTRATPRDDEARGFADLPPARGGTNQCK
jgi:O-antigen ligase